MLMKPISRVMRLALLVVVAAPQVIAAHAAGTRRYARPGGMISGACDSWADACELSFILDPVTPVAASGDQVWVQSGVYTPNPSDAANSLVMQDAVAIYGGFAGIETKLGQRNFKTNVTVLSGDIGAIGNASDNSYHVVSADTLTSSAVLDGFTITGGNARSAGVDTDLGGGIYNNNGSPTLRNLTIIGNAASASGGGMANADGSPAMTNIAFLANSAGASGGGLFGSGSTGHPSLKSVSFVGNHASAGAGMSDNGPGATLMGVAFTANVATNSGGGMFVGAGSSPGLTKVTFSGNVAGGEGGGLTCSGSTSVILTNVVFAGNVAGNLGGGVHNGSASMTLTNVSFNNNRATIGGGGMFNGTSASLQAVTFNSNRTGGNGGGLTNWGAATTMRNTTFYYNTADLNGGGIYSASGSTLTLKHVTASGNKSINPGNMLLNDSSTATVTNSILWDNVLGQVQVNSGTVTITKSIIVGGCPGGAACFGLISGNPKLGPLAKNGGFTLTMALKTGSAAIDKVACLADVKKDQRGVKRPQGPKCDVGAYERVP